MADMQPSWLRTPTEPGAVRTHARLVLGGQPASVGYVSRAYTAMGCRHSFLSRPGFLLLLPIDKQWTTGCSQASLWVGIDSRCGRSTPVLSSARAFLPGLRVLSSQLCPPAIPPQSPVSPPPPCSLAAADLPRGRHVGHPARYQAAPMCRLQCSLRKVREFGAAPRRKAQGRSAPAWRRSCCIGQP